MTKEEFCKKVKADAIMQLGLVVCHPVDDSTKGVQAAYQEVVEKFTAGPVTTAGMIVQSWNWAYHELAAIAAMKEGGAAK